MKQILSVQDLSCLGRCSLTVSMPVLSAMGHCCTPLPTTLLSTHTAFPNPHVHPLTGDILPICGHWQTIGAEFDAISIGYLSDPAQIEAVSTLLSLFNSFTILDPAMGDNGKLYSGISPEQIPAMAQLCSKAHLLLPNATEAALLTKLPYRTSGDAAYYTELAEGLLSLGAESVIITGASLSENTTGFFGLTRQTGAFSYQAPKLAKTFHGTGDLFSAVTAGGLLTGLTTQNAARLAAKFVERAISATPAETSYGIAFEPQLPWLWQQLQGETSENCVSFCPGF